MDLIIAGYREFHDYSFLKERACCPLTCPVLRHGVMPQSIEVTKVTKKDEVKWGSFSDIQSKATTVLRSVNPFFSRIDSGVLQRNIARLDAAYIGFWRHGRGFPAFRKRSNFKSWENKPGRCQFEVNRSPGKKPRYSKVMLPGIGWMRYRDSRPIPEDADIRTVTVIQKADGWYISVLLNLPGEVPEPKPLEECTGVNGLDRGINKLIASSDGSFVENPRFGTNKITRRRLRIRQRRVSRKVKGSNNRAKAGLRVARLHRRIALKRNAYQWQVASREVKKADVIALEDLNIKGMKKRCKPKRVSGRFMPNGQSAKRGLNRSISDAAWGAQEQKIEWIARKSGKLVVKVPAPHTSQEGRACGHVSPNNRDGEKFICEACGYIDHADTSAGRNIADRVGLKFVSNRRKKPTHLRKCLLPDVGESYALLFNDSASNGKRGQAGNLISKQLVLELLLNPEYERI
jgi:putative transposase